MKWLLKDPALVFSFALLVGYTFFSVVAFFEADNFIYLDVAWLSIISAIFVFFGSRIAFFGGVPRLRKIALDPNLFLGGVFTLFLALAAYILVTAPGIPLFAWAAGADSEALVLLREEFLKARTGWESILPYLNSVVAGVLVPYSLAYMFINNHKWRWGLFLIFIFYCVVFIEKVFFFKAIIPLLVVKLAFGKASLRSVFVFVLVTVGVVFGLGVVSGFGTSDIYRSGEAYFSNRYLPVGTFSYLMWRAISVPTFTAADSLSYFYEALRGEMLYGASTGSLSYIFGMERVYFERDVFGFQWGQTETGTASANSVFFIDAFVNFGYTGVILFSFLVGQVINYFGLTRDKALYALWPLLAFGFYVSGFVGNLLSGGFAFILIFSMFFELAPKHSIINTKAHIDGHVVGVPSSLVC